MILNIKKTMNLILKKFKIEKKKIIKDFSLKSQIGATTVSGCVRYVSKDIVGGGQQTAENCYSELITVGFEIDLMQIGQLIFF